MSSVAAISAHVGAQKNPPESGREPSNPPLAARDFAPLNTGELNLRAWCVENRHALIEALRFEGMAAELASGVSQLVWFLHDESGRIGRDGISLGERRAAQLLGRDRKTLRRWLEAALEWGIVAQHSPGDRRRALLWIDWRPVLLRVRAAAAAGRIADVPLFSFAGPESGPITGPVHGTSSANLVPSRDQIETNQGAGGGGETPRSTGVSPLPPPAIDEKEESLETGPITGPVHGTSSANRPELVPSRDQMQLSLPFEARAELKLDHLVVGQGESHGLLRQVLDGVHWLRDQFLALRPLASSAVTKGPASDTPAHAAPAGFGTRPPNRRGRQGPQPSKTVRDASDARTSFAPCTGYDLWRGIEALGFPAKDPIYQAIASEMGMRISACDVIKRLQFDDAKAIAAALKILGPMKYPTGTKGTS